MAHNWLNPGGPFAGLRSLLSMLTVLVVIGAVGIAFTMGPNAPGVAAGIVIVAVPTLLTALGALWLIDNVLAFIID